MRSLSNPESKLRLFFNWNFSSKLFELKCLYVVACNRQCVIGTTHFNMPHLHFGNSYELKVGICYCGGERPGSPYLCICWAKGLVWGRTPPRPDKVEDKGNGLPLRATLWTILWKRISIKKEQDNGRYRNI